MAEKHHVKTVPGEHVAPEHPEGGVEPIDGGHVQADDINVGLVGVVVLFFAVLLLVSLIALQAMFYNQSDAEAEKKTAAQGSETTDLGKARAQWETMLGASGNVENILADPKDQGGKKVYPKVTVTPISAAMADVVKQYGKPAADAPVEAPATPDTKGTGHGGTHH